MLIEQPAVAAPKRFFAAAKKDDTLELLIYDSIGESMWGGGLTAKSVKEKLDEAGDVKNIRLRINSPGGDVFEASAIYSLLTQHKAKVECFIDGLAASAAFTLAMAGDEIHISEAATMMCHNAWGMCIGYASDMQQTAEILSKISTQMCGIYSGRSGLSPAACQELMDAETWMNADEAVQKGFADDVIKRAPEEEEQARALAASYDISKFKARKRAEAPAPAAPTPEVPPAADADPDEGDACGCSCKQCKAGNCQECSNEDCTDDNCDRKDDEEQAHAEFELMREQFDVLSA